MVPSIALRFVLGEFADEGVLAGQRAVPTVLTQSGFTFEHESVRAGLNAALGSPLQR
jgi:NAD dependent epimerase/dehydratase family enzyme